VCISFFRIGVLRRPLTVVTIREEKYLIGERERGKLHLDETPKVGLSEYRTLEIKEEGN